MNIAIKPTKAVQVRQLKEGQPYLSERDIAELTGIPLKQVQGALQRRAKDKPKSRAPGTAGPIR